MKKIISIDYSYTSPSICVLGETFKQSQFYFMNEVKKVCIKHENYEGTNFSKKDFKEDVQRYDYVSNWAMGVLKKHYVEGETIVTMEGFSFGSRTGLIFNIAENGGLLKYKMHNELKVYPQLLAPTTVKKFWTGSGRSDKDAMVKTLYEKEGVDIVKFMLLDKLKSPAHDIVDSYAIGRMADSINNKLL